MIRFKFILIFICFQFVSYSQDELNLRLNPTNESTADAIYIHENYTYILGTALDSTSINIVIGLQDTFLLRQENVSVGKFYKLNLETNIIEDSIDINSNPYNFKIESSKLYNINDTLHYLTSGIKYLDTIFQDSTNLNFYPSFYHHFRYSLLDGKWENDVFPAFNELGVQDVRNNDAFISESGIYISNRTRNTATNSSDVVITKLDHNHRSKWTVKFENQLFHVASRILEDRNGNIVFTGIIDSLTKNRRNGYRHLFLQKLDSENGSTINKFVLEQNSTRPNAFIEDPEGGYIVASGDAIFQEGGRYPAITQILKIDENLDSICWRIQLSEDITYSLFWQIDNFTSLGNNEFIAVGLSDDPLNTGGNVGRIIKFNGDGKLIFDTEVQFYSLKDNLEQRITDISPYKNGFIACGTLRNYFRTYDIPDQQGWIVYINENGNTEISSSTKFSNFVSNSVKIYPNPIVRRIVVEFEKEINADMKYEIYSIEGIEIQRGIISKANLRTQIKLENINSGTYLLRLFDKDSIITKLFQKAK